MIAQHTLTHAIQYLRDAVDEQYRHRYNDPTDDAALRLVDPMKACAAYGLARRTLKRCGTLAAAIKDLQSQLKENES